MGITADIHYYRNWAAKRGSVDESWVRLAAQACQERRAWLEAVSAQFHLGYTPQEVTSWARGGNVPAPDEPEQVAAAQAAAKKMHYHPRYLIGEFVVRRPAPPKAAPISRPCGEKYKQFLAACERYAARKAMSPKEMFQAAMECRYIVDRIHEPWMWVDANGEALSQEALYPDGIAGGLKPPEGAVLISSHDYGLI